MSHLQAQMTLLQDRGGGARKTYVRRPTPPSRLLVSRETRAKRSRAPREDQTNTQKGEGLFWAPPRTS
jgi:hypothetical protein